MDPITFYRLINGTLRNSFIIVNYRCYGDIAR